MAGAVLNPRSVADLARTVPVFPLTSALLLPQARLPLNIFEPRYLAMIDATLAAARLVGMIQPLERETLAFEEGESDHPPLCPVGCVGRITSFSETGDGRYLLTLTGIARFRVAEELDLGTPYRMCRVDYAGYEGDLSVHQSQVEIDRDALLAASRAFFEASGVDIDWPALERLPDSALVTALAMLAPYAPEEKQALLEAPDPSIRAELLVALAERAVAADPTSPGPGHTLQ